MFILRDHPYNCKEYFSLKVNILFAAGTYDLMLWGILFKESIGQRVGFEALLRIATDKSFVKGCMAIWEVCEVSRRKGTQINVKLPGGNRVICVRFLPFQSDDGKRS